MPESGWTPDLLFAHFTALREADQRAITIKENADESALGLAREIQQYKDEKANELREQINSERGLYVTHSEFKVVSDYVTAQLSTTKALTTGMLLSAITAASLLVSIVIVIATHV